MPNETIARRYSAALFALAKESNSLDACVGELDNFVAALDSDAEIRDFFESPVVDRAQKIALLRDAFESRLSELTHNFLILLARKRRESLLPVIARQMHELLDADAGRAVATIATPQPLGQADLAVVGRRLSGVYGRPITPQPRVDGSLLGGMVVQIGDNYVDASVAGKLEEVRRHLLSSLDGTTTTASPNGKPTA